MSGVWTIDGDATDQLRWELVELPAETAWTAVAGEHEFWIVREGPRSFRLWADDRNLGTRGRRESAEQEAERLLREMQTEPQAAGEPAGATP